MRTYVRILPNFTTIWKRDHTKLCLNFGREWSGHSRTSRTGSGAYAIHVFHSTYTCFTQITSVLHYSERRVKSRKQGVLFIYLVWGRQHACIVQAVSHIPGWDILAEWNQLKFEDIVMKVINAAGLFPAMWSLFIVCELCHNDVIYFVHPLVIYRTSMRVCIRMIRFRLIIVETCKELKFWNVDNLNHSNMAISTSEKIGVSLEQSSVSTYKTYKRMWRQVLPLPRC